MKRTSKTILALCAALALVLALFAGCGKTEPVDAPTTAESISVPTDAILETQPEENFSQTEDPSTTSPDESTTNAVSESSNQEQGTTTAAATTTEPKGPGLTSKDIAEVLAYYQAAAKKTGAINAISHSSIGEASGEGAVAAIFKLVKPLIERSLANNGNEQKVIPGAPQKLVVSDIISASAIAGPASTTITMKIKDQPNAEAMENDEGPVGHAMGTMGNMKASLEGIINYGEDGKVLVSYKGCTVTVTIDHASGKIVNGTWKNTAYFSVQNASAYSIVNVKRIDLPLTTTITL